MRKRGSVRRDDVADLMRKKRAAVIKDWGHHRSLQRFLAEYFPSEWDRIKDCRLSYQEWEEPHNPGWYKVTPAIGSVCEKIPYCIQCTKANTERRVWETLNKYSRCTPNGRQLRFIHVVQTAPLTDDGQGWGLEASQNIPEFAKIVWESLEEFFGEGIGAYMSYQDFGEKGFNKRHPHMDLTLNGWKLDADGKPEHTRTVELREGGRRRWDEAIARRAARLRPNAQRGSAFFGRPTEGIRQYYKILRYQMREMIDLRKLEFVASANVIRWVGYRDEPPAVMTVDHFLESLAEYRQRVKPTPRSQLHRSMGHMAKRSIGKTESLMGGHELDHDADCPCGECGDWHRVFLEDVHDVRRVDYSLSEAW